jgi:hypothetical protein
MKHTVYNLKRKLNQIPLCIIIHNRVKNIVQNILYLVEHIIKLIKNKNPNKTK